MPERFRIKKYNAKGIIAYVLLFCLCILISFNTVTKYIEPTLLELCNVRAESIGISISNEVVENVMRDVGYLDLIILDRDENGRILALRANVIEMNRIASLISKEIQKRNDELKPTFISIPIGNFIGNSLLAGRGPGIEVKIIPTGTVNIEFKTEFLSTGINQTRHRVYLRIKSKMGIVAPFTSKKVDVINEVNVAETVLIGDVPTTYYNMEGVEDITADDTLNMWE